MPLTPNEQIFSPGDSDDWDLTIDLAAMANSIDSAITSVRTRVNQTSVKVANQAARDALFPIATRQQGDRVWRSDLGYEEVYLAAYNAATNLGGATPAGWYPAGGAMPLFDVQRTAAQTINAWTLVNSAWGTPIINNGFGSFANGVLTIQQPGVYRITGQIVLAASTGLFAVQFTKNSAVQDVGTIAYTNSSNTQALPLGTVERLAAGDTLRMFAYAATSNNLDATKRGAQMTVEYIQPSR